MPRNATSSTCTAAATTSAEIAELFGVSRATIYRAIQRTAGQTADGSVTG